MDVLRVWFCGMKPLPDQLLAKGMLDSREHGFSFRSYFRRSARHYLFLIVVFGCLLALVAYLENWIPFALLAGMLLGSLLRDVGWIRRTIQAWPFTAKVTDWDTVEKLAEESDSP